MMKLTLNQKYKIKDEIQYYREYIVQDISEIEGEPGQNEYIMYLYTDQQEFQDCLRLYSNYQKNCPDYINNVIDVGSVMIGSKIQSQNFQFIIINKVKNTLREKIESMAGKLHILTKVNLFLSMINELNRFQKLGYSHNNISPDTFVLNNEENQVFLTQFRDVHYMKVLSTEF